MLKGIFWSAVAIIFLLNFLGGGSIFGLLIFFVLVPLIGLRFLVEIFKLGSTIF